MAYSQVTSGGGQVTTEGQIHFISEDSADESKPEGPEDGNDNGRLPATGGVVRSLGFWLGVLLLFIGYLFMKKRQKEVD